MPARTSGTATIIKAVVEDLAVKNQMWVATPVSLVPNDVVRNACLTLFKYINNIYLARIWSWRGKKVLAD